MRLAIKVTKLPHYVGDLPAYQTKGASGMDLRAQLQRASLILPPGARVLVPTGLILEIPEDYEVQIRPRSGLSIKSGITVLNTPGTVDSDYRGEIKVVIANLGHEAFIIKDQDRVAQMVLCPIAKMILKLTDSPTTETDRGFKGFGSTGLSWVEKLELVKSKKP